MLRDTAPLIETTSNASSRISTPPSPTLPFTEVLGKTLNTTSHHNDIVDATWETTLWLPVPNQEPEPIELTAEAQQQIDILASRIHNAGLRSITIEACHVYAYESLDTPGFTESIIQQSAYAAALTRRLETDGINVEQVLFYDDYNPDPADGQHHVRMDTTRLLQIMNGAGYFPRRILFESAMAPLAKTIIDSLTEEGRTTVDKDTGAVLLQRDNIELYRASDDMVSCAMLDASLTIVKLAHLAEGVVNILPRRSLTEEGGMSYRGQQKKMREILREYAAHSLITRVLPVFTLFTSPEGIAAGSHHLLRKHFTGLLGRR